MRSSLATVSPSSIRPTPFLRSTYTLTFSRNIAPPRYGPCRPNRSESCVVAATAAVEEEEIVARVLDVNRSYYPKKIDTDCVKKPWYVVNAEGQILGRMATLIAVMIRGKMNPAYAPSMDMGAFIVVVNAEKVTVSGRKYTDKVYFRHTNGRPGKSKFESFKSLQNRIPERIIEHAVKGMLPKGRLGRRLFHHLKVYAGPEHPHEAQKPIDITPMIDAKPKDYVGLIQEMKT